MSTGKVLLGLVAGAAAGAVLGILFAPEKGSVTRKQISQKGQDYLDQLTSKFNDFIATASSELEDAKSETEDLVDKGKDKFRKAQADIKNSATNY